MKTAQMVRSAGWIKAALYGLLILGLYWSTFTVLISGWGRADYSYCYLMPFVIACLIWDKRQRLMESPSEPSWAGLFPLGLGIAFFWLGELGGEYFTLYMSFWLVVIGLCWLHFGWKKVKTISFALIMILSMFPLPYFIHGKLSVKLQLISSKLGVAMMHIYGMSVYQEGNVIDLGIAQLQVVEACSGLSYLISLIILGLLVAYFFKSAFWKRAILVISTVPIAIVSNSLRIAITGILYEAWSPKVAEGFFHGFSGWFIFMFSLSILLVEMWALSKIRFKGRVLHNDKDLPEEYSSSGLRLPRRSSALAEQSPRNDLIATWHQFIVAVILIGAAIALSHGINFRENIPITRSLSQFPLEVGKWSGIRGPMDQMYIDELDLSDYVIIDYRDPKGKNVNFYVAYYESQRKGESIHSPATCLPGSGWIFKEAGTANLPIPGYSGGSMKVNRAFMEKWDQRQLSYYFFLQRGRILTNAYQLKIFAFWDALTKQRTDGALVRLITPVYGFEDLRDADGRLAEFTQKIMSALTEFIPGENTVNSRHQEK